MVEVHLPFSTLYVCEICGKASYSKKAILACEAVPTWETPDVELGDAVSLFECEWGLDGTGRAVGRMLTEKSRQWWVRRLFYARPDQSQLFGPRTELTPHQFCIELYRSQRWEGSGYVAQNPRTKDRGNISLRTMPYAEFLLWREGDPAKLAAAGYIDSQKLRPYPKIAI